MTGFWSYYFAWYQGGVYGNLIASAITTSLVGALAVLKIREHLAAHREHEAAEREAHRKAIQADLAAHHEKVTAHVTKQLAPVHQHLGTTPPDGGAP